MIRLSHPAKQRKLQCCYEVLSQLSKLETEISEWQMVIMTEIAKMQPDSGYLEDNPDPDGRKGMMARFMMNDNMLTLTNCLQLVNR